MNYSYRLKTGILTLVLLMTGLSSCTRESDDSSPNKVLESYIQISFAAATAQDKKRMEELLTGDTKARLSSWSDDQFTKAFIETKKKFQGLKVLETKKVNEQEVALTYELSYQEGPQDKLALVTQRKLCTITHEADGWKIKEVRSIRESIEYLKELSLP